MKRELSSSESLKDQNRSNSTQEIFQFGRLEDQTVYKKLNQQFLADSLITHRQRYILIAWILQEMGRTKSLRQTFALCCKYLDVFLMEKKREFPLREFQNLGIACWILATKISGERLPPINFAGYNQQQIWKLENQVCVILDFQLHPLTYVSLVGCITKLWDQFAQIENLSEQYRFWGMSQNSVILYQNVLNILDGVNLTHLAYKFPMPALVLHAFYLQCRHLLKQNNHNSSTLSQIQHLIRSQFFVFLSSKCHAFDTHNIHEEIINLVLPFHKNINRERGLTNNESRRLPVLRHLQLYDNRMCDSAKMLLPSIRK